MEDVQGHFSFRKRSPVAVVTVKPMPQTHFAPSLKNAQSKSFFTNSGELAPINETANADLLDTDHFEFPTYFTFFLNVMFVFFMIPFRITKRMANGGVTKKYEVVVHKNILQMVIVAAIHFVMMLLSLTVLSTRMSVHLRKKPNHFFYLIIYFAIIGFLAAFFYSAWRKHESYRNMMENLKKSTSGSFWKTFLLLTAVSVIPIAQQTVKLTLGIIEIVSDSDSESKLQNQLKLELEKLWLDHLHNATQNPNGITDPLLITIGGISMGGSELLDFYRTLVEIIVFIAALSVREITKKYLRIFDTVPPIKSLHQMSDLYLKMERQIGFINDFTGPIVLAWFGLATSFFLDTFFNMFSANKLALKFVDFLSILNYTAALLVACDARDMALKSKTILLERGSSQNLLRLSPAFVAYLELSEEDVGVRGSDFFVISYQFVGKMVGMLATFLLIMLQLNLELMENPLLCKENANLKSHP